MAVAPTALSWQGSPVNECTSPDREQVAGLQHHPAPTIKPLGDATSARHSVLVTGARQTKQQSLPWGAHSIRFWKRTQVTPKNHMKNSPKPWTAGGGVLGEGMVPFPPTPPSCFPESTRWAGGRPGVPKPDSTLLHTLIYKFTPI